MRVQIYEIFRNNLDNKILKNEFCDIFVTFQTLSYLNDSVI